MQIIAYLRVSTDEQADSKNGLKAQLAACTKYAEQQNLTLVSFTDAGIGGAAPLDARPALFQALAALKRTDILLVAKRDRLGRDPILVAMIEAAAKRKGARVVSAAGEGTENDDPGSILMRRMVDAFSEYERLIIKSRTKAALQAKIADKELVGEVRFGYDAVPDPRRSEADGHTPMMLVENEQEQAAICLMAQWRSEGKSYRTIAALLAENGIKTKKGNSRWVYNAVRQILQRAA